MCATVPERPPSPHEFPATMTSGPSASTVFKIFPVDPPAKNRFTPGLQECQQQIAHPHPTIGWDFPLSRPWKLTGQTIPVCQHPCVIKPAPSHRIYGIRAGVNGKFSLALDSAEFSPRFMPPFLQNPCEYLCVGGVRPNPRKLPRKSHGREDARPVSVLAPLTVYPRRIPKKRCRS